MAKELYAGIGTTDVLKNDKERIRFLKSMAKIVKPIESCIVQLSCPVYERFLVDKSFHYKFENGNWVQIKKSKIKDEVK